VTIRRLSGCPPTSPTLNKRVAGHPPERSRVGLLTDILDGLLDSIYGNGYDEQVNQLDDLRAKLESTDE